MQSRALIIVGMHRSGTSLITNWLFHCGLQVGERLVEANTGNQDGHYEDVEFLHMHEEILTSNGLPSTGLILDKVINISEYQMGKLKTVLKIKEEHFEQWGWKEPRTCLFLDTYRKLIPDAKYLVIVRDHAAVVNSLLKRSFDAINFRFEHRGFFTRLKWNWFKKTRKKRNIYKTNAEHYLNVWINYNRHILDLLAVVPETDYVVINYSLLEKDDRRVFSFLTEEWGFKLDYCPFNKVYKKRLISPVGDLTPFIKDKSLIEKAIEIENEFKRYMIIV